MPLIYNKEQALLPMINSIAQQYNVPPALILAHMKQESSFNPNAYRAEPAIGDASIGLMQVLLGTARKFVPEATAEQMYDPTFNTNVGTAYIAENLNRYEGNILDAIAAYNAGTARKNDASQYVNSKGVTNVQDYVDKVYKNYNDYTNWLSQGAAILDVDTGLIIAFSLLAGGLLIYAWKRYERN